MRHMHREWGDRDVWGARRERSLWRHSGRHDRMAHARMCWPVAMAEGTESCRTAPPGLRCRCA
eukprot:805884-Prymnesium_polylepis.1